MPTSTPLTEALSLVDSLLDSIVSSPWRFPKDEFATRLRAVINSPYLINQGSINVCGPASFFMIWCTVDPVGFCKYAIDMYLMGHGNIGNLLVRPDSSLVNQEYSLIQDRLTIQCPSCDWMVMSSLRDSENHVLDFNGTPEEDVSGITTPGEIEKWLNSTGIFIQVSNQASIAIAADIDHAAGLLPSKDTFIIMLINAVMLPQSGSSSLSSLARFFPNHFIVLQSRAEISSLAVKLDFWSWGETYSAEIDIGEFRSNYYGSIVCSRS